MDTFISQFLNNLTGKSACLDALFIFLAVYFPIIFAILFTAYLAKQKKYKIWFFAWAIVAFAFFIKEAISLFYFRIRPFGAIEGINNLIGKSVAEASFPSGHTMVSFVLAFCIFWLNKKWGALFLFGAFLISVSRVIVGVHYPSDVLAGIIIAFVLSFLIRKKAK